MVRQFKLANEKGQEFSMMDIYNYCLLTDPSGLGYSYNTEYQQLGTTFITNLRKLEQGSITGIINFVNYDNYKKFIDFIEKSESLKFIYKIPFKNGEKEFFKDVNIQSITKTEIQKNNMISETIVFESLSLWYEENTIEYKIEPKTNEIRWDFKWDSRFADYDSRNLHFINEGHVEAPILVEMNGNLVNPKIELYVDSQLYQIVKIKVKIAKYEKLLYGTKENNFYIMKQKTNGEKQNLFNLEYIDFNNDNVIRLPKNCSCEIRLTADNEVLSAKLTILPQYKVV